MAISSINGYTTTRITGLSSGFDTDSLIQQALQSKQSQLDRLYQNRTKLEWKRDAYTDVNKKINEFTSKFMSQLSENNIFSSSVYKAYKISISDKYDTYFSISGTSNAMNSRHEITKATLAEYATIEGAKYRNRVAGLTGASNANSLASVTGTKELQADWEMEKLSDLEYADGTKVFDFSSSSDRVSFSVNGTTFTFDQDETLSDVIREVNDSASAKAKMSVADGKIYFESTVKGTETKLEFKNVAGPDVFGKDGAFGIKDTSITPKSLIHENMTLAEIADATGKKLGGADGGVSFSINGKEFRFGKDTTLKDVLDAVNDDPDAKVTMAYDQDKDRFMLRSDVTGSGTEITTKNIGGSNFFGEDGITGIIEDTTTKYQTIDRSTDTIATAAAKMGIDLQLDKDGKFSFTVNGVDFSFKTTDSLQTMMNEVNSNEDAKAKLTYSQITDSFVFTSSETGRNAVVTVGNKDGANAFGGADSFFGVAEGEARGSDATIVIDGETISQSSNTFTLDGIQFTLKADFDAENNRDNLGPATFTVEQDIDQVVEKVTQFVSEYNKLTQELYALTIEEMDYDYSPLTQDEKADLSQEDIEKWETEAKKGILRNDNTIKNLLSKLRSNFFSVVEGSGLSAYDIGFNTSKYSQGQYGGQITFDEDKFREMLQKDPDAVAKVMAGTSDAVDDLTEYQESGLVSRLFDQMSDFKSTIQGKNLKNTNQQIDDTNDSMNDLIAKMYEEQERLYIQYAQMETLLSQYQSQSTWLAQQLSAL